MMLQVVLDHLFRHLSGRDTKIAARPEIPFPIAFFQLRKRLKQFRRSMPLDPPHDFAWSQIRRRWHQDMDMILAHDFLENLDLEGFARLTDELTGIECNIPF
jgi:hypothetical protein